MAKFADIIGQEQIKEHLQNALKTNKVSHAYILNGEKNSGKEFIAKIFASALQCEKTGISLGMAEPCGECHSCIQMAGKNQPDVIYVTHEKPGSIGVEDIRSQNRREQRLHIGSQNKDNRILRRFFKGL